MVIEKSNFIIYYDEELSYIPEVVEYLELRMDEIMSFFKLDSLSSKKKIIVYNDLELYKRHIEKFYQYQDYMRADTNDGNINLLSVEAAHNTKEHSQMTVDELKSTILHEFVHICQQEAQKETIDNEIIWFWEALATNLGNPEKFSKILITATNDEINNFIFLPYNYPIAFTIGNYILENYTNEEILEYVKYPTKLLNDSELILNDARRWSNSKRL
ncbi:MAG: hypothetical protein IK997_03310 [Bacilli bacterium]|nr:hypothetical protein [Bacilli bacterium]